MTREQFERAEKLDKEIQKYADLIDRIRLGCSVKAKKNEKAREELKRRGHDSKSEWTLSRFFRLTLEGRKVVVIPRYEFAQGIEMDADSELIETIIDYLEKKKKACEEKFAQIGGGHNE